MVPLRGALLAVVVETIDGVVAILILLAHPLGHLVPLLNRKTGIERLALVVALGRTKGGQRELVVVVQTLRDVYEPVVTLERGTLYITVTPTLGQQHAHGPAALRQTRREAQRDVLQTVVTDTIRERTALLGINRVRHDVNRTTDRGRRNLRGTHTALRLHRAGYIRQTGPVRPVHAAPLHVVHRHTVNHHGYVGRLETTHVDLRVTEATTVFRYINTRGRFQNLGELLTTEFVLDVLSRDGRNSHRRLTLHGHRLGNHHILHGDCLGVHLNRTQCLTRSRRRDLAYDSLVVQVADLNLLCALFRLEREGTIQIRACTLRRTRDDNRSTNQRLIVFIYERTRDDRLRCDREAEHQTNHQK